MEQDTNKLKARNRGFNMKKNHPRMGNSHIIRSLLPHYHFEFYNKNKIRLETKLHPLILDTCKR